MVVGPADDERVEAPPYQVRLFGAMSVTAPDGADALPHGRKARALLAYVLLSGDEAVPRERLAGLLWGERSEVQARASLRQTLYEMRSLSTGEQPLVSLDRANVRIGRGRAATDLDHFRVCARAGDASSLAAMLGDPPRDLLDDLGGSDAAFDAWLANERVRHRDERRQAAIDVGSRALAGGDAHGAHRLASCLLAADPLDEAAASLAMESGHAQGDRDSIRRVYTRLADALQRDLRVAPSEETSAVHRRLMDSPVPRPAAPAMAGVLSIGPGDEPRADPSVVQAPSPAQTDTTVRPPSTPITGFVAVARAHRRSAIAAAVVVVSAVVLAFWGLRPDASARRRLLVVQPLRVAPDDAAALALRRGLATGLARIMVGNDATLLVADPDGTVGHAAEGVEPRDRFAVIGDAQNHAGTLRVDIKLLSTRDNAILWSSSFSRSANELDALREQIASKLADVTVCAIGGRNPTLDDLGLETLRLYLAACENKHDDWGESARLLTQVTQRKPGFAHAWAMLAAGTASAAIQRSGEEPALYKQARIYAAHALALDAAEGDAYYARAASLPTIGRWAERIAILRAGHAADPGNAPVDEMMAWNLAGVGRWQEALGYAQQAEAFDPFSPGAASLLAQLQGYGNFSPDASGILQRARSRFPTIDFAVKNEFFIAANGGDPRRALAILDDAAHPLHLAPEREALWRTVVAARVDPSAARIDEAARVVLASSSRPFQGGTPVVEKLVILNRLEQAYAFAEGLDRGGLDNSDTTIFFRADMAPFRADRRFMGVALRFGLVPIWMRTGQWPDFCGNGSVPYDCRREAQRALSAHVPLLAKAP